MKAEPAVYRPRQKATPFGKRTHAIAAGTALFLFCCTAQAQFAYDNAAWYPDRIPAIPAVPNVPPVPNIYPPVLLPNTGLPVPYTPTPPVPQSGISADVILSLTATTISGCKYGGQLCVFGLPVVRTGNTATGSIGGLLFTFQTQ